MSRGRGRGRGGAHLHNLQLGESSFYFDDRTTDVTLHHDYNDGQLQDSLYKESDEESLRENQLEETSDGSHHEAKRASERFNHNTQLFLHRNRTSADEGPSKRKGRGPAIGMDKPDKECRPVIKFKKGHLVSNNQDCFIIKIGIWAKDQSRFPFRTLQFDSLPKVECERLEKDVDGDVQKLIKETCRRLWNDARSKLYRFNYTCHATREEALCHPTKGMSPDTWRTICEDVFLGGNWKERSARKYDNRSCQFLVHKSGRTSFAQRAVTLERLIAMASQCPENEDAIFQEVFGREHKGRKWGMGRGITMQENNAFLSAQVEELTLQLAKQDARDKERDAKEVEIRQKLADLEARFASLSQSSIPQIPSYFQAPYQLQVSRIPEQSQRMDMPNQQQLV